MISWFYFLVFALSLVLTGSFLIRNKNVDTVFILFSILITINCGGRYLLAVSKSLEMAIWANKFLYIGGIYAPIFILLVLSRLCNIKISRVLLIFLNLYAALVMCLVFTIGKYGIYYKNVELGIGNGYSYLIKSYGPLHVLYPLMMIMYALSMVFYIFYAVRKRNQISFRVVMTICITCISIILIYILERVTHSTISFLSVGYLVGIILLIKFFERLNMYDMSSNIVASIERMNEYGYIVFDNIYRYVNANSMIKELFPEINQWQIDEKVMPSESYLYKEVVEYLIMWNGQDKSDKIIRAGDLFFQCTIRKISYGKKENIGYLLEFVDKTLERKYYNAIEEYNITLEKEVAEKTENILHIKDMMVLGMADMVESRDNNTGGHIKRTSSVVSIFSSKLNEFCDEFGFDETFLKQVKKAAPMHDLGKIAIDDVVLRKPGKYTEEEFNEIKRHTVEGARIVENILGGIEDGYFVQIAKNIACYHHEKWNGQGYPLGLAGTNIPIEARIMALADVFDALVSKRCYKEAFSYDKAFEIIEESLGTHFDPKLGKIFLMCRNELEKLYSEN